MIGQEEKVQVLVIGLQVKVKILDSSLCITYLWYIYHIWE